ncbi:GNAT family N-acetyltransferase [Streptomyces sp. NPDC002018]|uniref:GNAT family N-acetyltransferase n=1 Tax=Streptomyces sp. NPDC002018 TaxID=3364629 RepID=UPI0036B38584
MNHRNHVIRAVQAEEWAKVKEIRLDALQDPAAPVAFLETYEQGLAHPDLFWQQRAAGVSPRFGTSSGQFIAEAPDGSWSGSVVVLIEAAGSSDFFGSTIAQAQGHLVGVYVRPEHRGSGLLGALVAEALDWAWTREEPRLSRVRLYVHEANPRAQAAYRKLGFVPTGTVIPFEHDPLAKEVEMAIKRP